MKLPESLRISVVACFLLVGLFSINFPATAEQKSNIEKNVVVAPSQVIMQTNDLGKKYSITITNNTSSLLTLSAEEGLVSRSNSGATVPVEQAITQNFFEIPSQQISIDPGQKFELIVRTKIIKTTDFNVFPALHIKQATKNNEEVAIAYAFYIPFIIQDSIGDLLMDTFMTINIDKITFSPDIYINGKVNNKGNKFFDPKGTVVILKDSVKLQEQEITSQISGILFPGETKEYQYNWTLFNSNWNSVGEYTVESRITNDLSDKVTVSKIKFIYIPMQLIYLIIGVTGGLTSLIIITSVIKHMKKRVKK